MPAITDISRRYDATATAATHDRENEYEYREAEYDDASEREQVDGFWRRRFSSFDLV